METLLDVKEIVEPRGDFFGVVVGGAPRQINHDEKVCAGVECGNFLREEAERLAASSLWTNTKK